MHDQFLRVPVEDQRIAADLAKRTANEFQQELKHILQAPEESYSVILSIGS